MCVYYYQKENPKGDQFYKIGEKTVSKGKEGNPVEDWNIIGESIKCVTQKRTGNSKKYPIFSILLR